MQDSKNSSNTKLRVLIACEYSGVVRSEFEKRGWDAWSCDLLPTERPGNHYCGNVSDILRQHWDLLIGHPPCTFLCNSGVHWLHKNADRWKQLDEAANFFKTLLECDVKHIAIENPIPHRYAVERIGRKYDQKIQPYQFGHTESKATCFWLKNLPLLQPTNDVSEEWKKLPKKEAQRLHMLPPGPDRWKERSRTFSGIAKAMSEQWGRYVENLTHAQNNHDSKEGNKDTT